MSKHTPGPWTAICPPSSSLTTRMIQGSNSEIVAHIGPQGWARDVDVEVADARLIAAAPDLLAALRLCAATMERRFGDCFEVAKARKAIAKAEGRAA